MRFSVSRGGHPGGLAIRSGQAGNRPGHRHSSTRGVRACALPPRRTLRPVFMSAAHQPSAGPTPGPLTGSAPNPVAYPVTDSDIHSLPHVAVPAGGADPAPLPRTPDNTGTAAARAAAAAAIDALTLNHPRTMAVLLLQHGSVLAEWYSSATPAPTRHFVASMGRTPVGAVTAQLIHRGVLNPDTAVQHYVPELANSGFVGATIRQLLSMRSGVTSSAMGIAAAMAVGPNLTEAPPADGIRNYLLGLPQDVPHGSGYKYRAADTEVLTWACEQAAGKPFPQLVSELVWAPTGAEQDALVLLDAYGVSSLGSCMLASVRDIARFGLATMPSPQAEGAVLPPWFVQDTRYGRSADAEGKLSMFGILEVDDYRNQCWVLDASKGITLVYGALGKMLYTHPDAGLVAVVIAGWEKLGDMMMMPEFLGVLGGLADQLVGAQDQQAAS